MQTYVMIDGNRHGPYSPDEVRQYLSTGQLDLQMMAWREGMADWQPLETFPEFASSSATPTPKPTRFRVLLHVSLAVIAVTLCAASYWLVSYEKKSSSAAANGPVAFAASRNRAALANSPIPAGQSTDRMISSNLHFDDVPGIRVVGIKTTEQMISSYLLQADQAASSVAGHPDWPKTLVELNQWYSQPPPGENAAGVFLRAYNSVDEQIRGAFLMDARDRDKNLPFISTAATDPLPGDPLPEAMKYAISNFMQRTQPAWDLFEKGSTLTQSRYPIDLSRGKFCLPAPDLPQVEWYTRFEEVFALGYADTHRATEAGDSLLIGYAISRSLESAPLLLLQASRAHCNAMMLRALEQTLNRIALPPQSLARLQDVLAPMADRDASGENFNRALLGEKLIYLPNFIVTNAEADRQFYVESWDQMFAARNVPFPVRLKADDFVVSRNREALARNFALSGAWFKPGKMASLEAQVLASLRLAQTAVALERFHAVGVNRYPDTLAELSPKFLASVPADPFDGQPLRYDKSGNGYTLHSIGPADASDAIKKSLAFAVLNPPKPDAAIP
jgi:uncharacterized protein YunC (DUF1805 family)